MHDLPVFIRSGAIIPMQNLIQNTDEKGDGVLKLNVWNGAKKNTFTYYEDDGTSYDYQKGLYYKRDITFDPIKREISLSAVEGGFISKYGKIELVLHGFEKVNLKIKGKVINGAIANIHNTLTINY